jgi:hypothetical protein
MQECVPTIPPLNEQPPPPPQQQQQQISNNLLQPDAGSNAAECKSVAGDAVLDGVVGFFPRSVIDANNYFHERDVCKDEHYGTERVPIRARDARGRGFGLFTDGMQLVDGSVFEGDTNILSKIAAESSTKFPTNPAKKKEEETAAAATGKGVDSEGREDRPIAQRFFNDRWVGDEMYPRVERLVERTVCDALQFPASAPESSSNTWQLCGRAVAFHHTARSSKPRVGRGKRAISHVHSDYTDASAPAVLRYLTDECFPELFRGGDAVGAANTDGNPGGVKLSSRKRMARYNPAGEGKGRMPRGKEILDGCDEISTASMTGAATATGAATMTGAAPKYRYLFVNVWCNLDDVGVQSCPLAMLHPVLSGLRFGNFGSGVAPPHTSPNAKPTAEHVELSADCVNGGSATNVFDLGRVAVKTKKHRTFPENYVLLTQEPEDASPQTAAVGEPAPRPADSVADAWFRYSCIQPTEALLFVNYDSWRGSACRFVMHSGADGEEPGFGGRARVRKSMEVRVLVLLEHRQ